MPEQPKGGSEILIETLTSSLDFSGINLISSNCHQHLIDKSKKNILLQGLSYDQENVQGMKSPVFVEDIDCFVYVSHWSYEKFREKFNAPPWKSEVIKNATNPFPAHAKPKGKIKLIYTSTPWRGLDVLLQAFKLLNRNDVEIDVYSSTEIYGKQFAASIGNAFDGLFYELSKTPGVNLMGYRPNHIVRDALAEAHIFAYPSTFEETSCIAAIEAMCAGCQAVVTNYGALPETCGEFGSFVSYDSNRSRLALNYAKALDNAIDQYWSNSTQQLLEEQTTFYNKHWTWPKRFIQWQNLLTKIREQ